MATAIVLTAIFLVTFAKSTCACGGYKLQVDYIRTCHTENVVELSKNISATLTKNCELELFGCVTANVDITNAEIDYVVFKNLVKRSGKINGCSHVDNTSNDFLKALDTLGLLNRCPVSKGTVICFDNKPINVRKYKLGMNVAVGHIRGKLLAITNAGKSCIEFSFKLENTVVTAFALPAIHG